VHVQEFLQAVYIIADNHHECGMELVDARSCSPLGVPALPHGTAA
jgi:hypothetical protein